jgi:riboflavin kinase/FMN adenylyltransferase
MQIFRGLPSYPPDAPPAVVALGVFDGIHLGHQAILDLAVERARATQCRSLACTFDPHPLEVLRPEQAPVPIATLDERLELIGARAVDAAMIIPFTPAFSGIEPEDFVGRVLVGNLRARAVVVGFNHTFGRGARGDATLLQALARALGFTAHVVAPLSVGGVVVSSTAVREALRAGDVETARRLLGRPYAIRGVVVRGAGRGRRLGFPTANLKTERPVLVPTGVYAAYVRVGDGRDGHKAVVNIGYRPTFGEHEYWVEAYLLDFDGDLYDRLLRVELHRRLREERKFPDVDALRAQVREDIAAALVSL